MTLPRTLQDLAPQDAHLFLTVERFLHEELQLNTSGRHFLVALSGGADSSALLLFALLMRNRWQSKVSAAHANHGLRPESKDEEQHVVSLCSKYEVACPVERLPVREHAERTGCGIEESARDLRYAFLENQRERSGADWILTGHHLNDLAEDIIMRLLRGTGWPGLSGMSAMDPDRSLLRPLLLTRKSCIKDLLHRCDLGWTEDRSNKSNQHLRNRVRQTILPLLLEENPSFLSNASQLWTLGRIDETFWEKRLQSVDIPSIDPDNTFLLRRSVLDECDEAVRLRLYKKILDKMGPGQAVSITLFKLDKAFRERAFERTFQFPGGKQVRVAPGGLEFSTHANGSDCSFIPGA